MNPIRVMTLSTLSLVAYSAFAAGSDTATPTLVSPDLSLSQGSLIPRPTFGIRVGFGEWNQPIISGGVDVTFQVPLLPLPQLRLDAEAWAEPSDTSGKHGNSLSLLEMQSFAVAYVGLGPSFYFSDDEGYHRSGFAAKVLAGATLPGSTFIEAGVILGASPSPLMISIGKRY